MGQLMGLIEGKEYYTKSEVNLWHSNVYLEDSKLLSRLETLYL
jgi:hypothetical protein